MNLRCPKCNKEISRNYVRGHKNIEHIKCPSCRVALKEKNLSKIILAILTIIPMFLLMNYLDSFLLRVVLIFAFANFSGLFIRPFLAQYEIDTRK